MTEEQLKWGRAAHSKISARPVRAESWDKLSPGPGKWPPRASYQDRAQNQEWARQKVQRRRRGTVRGEEGWAGSSIPELLRSERQQKVELIIVKLTWNIKKRKMEMNTKPIHLLKWNIGQNTKTAFLGQGPVPYRTDVSWAYMTACTALCFPALDTVCSLRHLDRVNLLPSVAFIRYFTTTGKDAKTLQSARKLLKGIFLSKELKN